MLIKNTIFILGFLVLLCGCAVKPGPGPGAPVQDLGVEARLIYNYLRAQDHLARGNFLEGAAHLEEMVRIRPSAELLMELARSYWNGRDQDRAVESAQKAADLFPGEPDLLFFQAELLLAAGRQDEAVEVLEQYREKAPHDLGVLLDLASFYLEAGDHPKVMDILDQVPEGQRTPEIYYYMGRAAAELGDRRKAVIFMRRAVDEDPMFLQAWAELAFIYEQDRDYLQAEKIYEKLLGFGETNPDLILRIIELNLKLNNPDKALDFLERGPVDVQFRLDGANQFIRNSFYDHAYEILDQIRLRGAYPPTVYFYLALIAYEGWSDPDEALDQLHNIPEDDFYYLQSLSFMIQIHYEQKNYGQALDLARLGRAAQTPEVRFFLFESVLLEILDDHQAALDVIELGLEKWPLNSDLLFRKGVVLDKMGQREMSLTVMEEIISVDQDHHEALNYVGYTLADDNKDLDRALVLIKRALSLDPYNGYYIDSLAWVYYRQSNYSLAWKEIQRAVELVDTDPVIWEHYGDIARVMSMPDLALFGYKNALAHDPEDPDRILDKLQTVQDELQEKATGPE
ncbi:tetratricopeptide repeat protein [Desulfonatronovibrio hydrogenovorans]|uniref:tetratricopeptide repeat protein n=1 Tax=Desulfonatronovibrio hydrogenovorans TaxID=53245 RepID=UPI000490B1A7|nr:tetratricopeptide repeat protein [Desulfonatronovibrio hydrogenovorans]